MSFGYFDFLTLKGFKVQKVSSQNGASSAMNLARRAGVKNFILVTDARGYDAISIAPYALQTRSFVLFINSGNVNEVVAFLDEARPLKVVLYGPHSQKTVQAISKFNPDVINTGNRFTNNIEILKRLSLLSEGTQLTLTNGEFIEDSLITGGYPNLLIGKNLPPQVVVDFLRSSRYKIAVLVGNDLVASAQYIRDNTPLKDLFIKFAQGIPEYAFNQVLDLDKFYLPKFDLNISIVLVQYNTATKQLEVTYRNNVADQLTFVKSSITLSAGGKTIGKTGDLIPFDIPGGEDRTVVYDVDLSAAVSAGASITADFFTLYGEDTNSLEKLLQQSFSGIKIVEYADDSVIHVGKVTYDFGARKLVVELFNDIKETVYTRAYVTLPINLEQQSFKTNSTISLPTRRADERRVRLALVA